MNAKLFMALMLGALSSMSATAKDAYENVSIKDNEVKDTSLYATKKLNEVVINGYKPLYTSSKLSSSLRLGQPLLQIPQNIQVINKDLLNDLSILSADDGIQRTISGVSKLEHWSDYIRINMHGTTGTRAIP